MEAEPFAVLRITTQDELRRALRASMRADGALPGASRPVLLRIDGRMLAARSRG